MHSCSLSETCLLLCDFKHSTGSLVCTGLWSHVKAAPWQICLEFRMHHGSLTVHLHSRCSNYCIFIFLLRATCIWLIYSLQMQVFKHCNWPMLCIELLLHCFWAWAATLVFQINHDASHVFVSTKSVTANKESDCLLHILHACHKELAGASLHINVFLKFGCSHQPWSAVSIFPCSIIVEIKLFAYARHVVLVRLAFCRRY